MPYCTKCGKQNPDTAKFCTGCGATFLTKEETSPSVIYKKPFSENKKKITATTWLLAAILFIGSATSVYFIFFNSKKENTTNSVNKTNPADTSAAPSQLISSNKQSGNSIINNQQEPANSSNIEINTEQFQSGYYIVNGSENHKVYFHNTPDTATRRKAYFSTQEQVYVQKIQNGFGYVEFTNTGGQTSYGWIEARYLIVKPK